MRNLIPKAGARDAFGDVFPGKTFYVLSTSAGMYPTVANDFRGLSDEGVPVLHNSLASANTHCVASRGDHIKVLPGHTETLTATLALKAGVTVVCQGGGDMKPTFTINAAIPGLNITGDDVKWHGGRIIAGSSATAASRLIRVAASDIEFTGVRFEMGYDMYHMIVTVSGDNIDFDNCQFINAVTTNASVHPQTAFLNIGGTNVVVQNSKFHDMDANKAERWRTCVEGGKLTADILVKNCLFICRGVATATRSAGASGEMYTIDCRGISPSSNTSVGALFTPTYQYIIQSYNVAAVNKVGVVTVTTSDLRTKRNVEYLKAA